MKKFLLVFGIAAAGTTFATTSAQAQYSSGSNYSSGPSYSGGGSKMALGFRRAVTPFGDIGQISGLMQVTPTLKLGLDLGFANDFDTIYFDGEGRFDLINRGAASMFAEGDVGYAKLSAGGASAKAFVMATLLGFNYQLTTQLQLSMAYGLQFAFGHDARNNHFGTTNAGDFAGNFGVHWYF